MVAMQEHMEAYENRFDEQFPLMLVRGLADAEIIALIDQCIADGKVYSPELEKDAYY
jgi:hypothetical protein